MTAAEGGSHKTPPLSLSLMETGSEHGCIASLERNNAPSVSPPPPPPPPPPPSLGMAHPPWRGMEPRLTMIWLFQAALKVWRGRKVRHRKPKAIIRMPPPLLRPGDIRWCGGVKKKCVGFYFRVIKYAVTLSSFQSSLSSTNGMHA